MNSLVSSYLPKRDEHRGFYGINPALSLCNEFKDYLGKIYFISQPASYAPDTGEPLEAKAMLCDTFFDSIKEHESETFTRCFITISSQVASPTEQDTDLILFLKKVLDYAIGMKVKYFYGFEIRWIIQKNTLYQVPELMIRGVEV